MLALGVSGYSYMNNWQYYNFRTLKGYTDSLKKGRLPIWKGGKLATAEEQARRNLVFGIKCKIEKTNFEERYGFKPEEKFGECLDKLERLGLISNSKTEIKLTYAGKLFAEEVARYFM